MFSVVHSSSAGYCKGLNWTGSEGSPDAARFATQAMSTRSLISTDSPRRGNFSGQPFQFKPLTYSIVDVGSAGEWDLWNDWPEKSGLSLKWNELKPGREQDCRCVFLTKNSELAELLDVIRRHIHVSKLLTRNTRIAVRRRCRYWVFLIESVSDFP